MKNFIKSLLAFLVVGGLVYFALTKFLGAKPSGSQEVTDGDVQKTETSDSHGKEDADADSHDEEDTLDVDVDALQADYKNWSAYSKKNIDLAYDFLPIDEEGEEISKEDFLDQLITGEYLVYKTESGEQPTYELLLLDEEADPKVGRSVKGIAATAKHYFLKEGTDFPEFDVTDLNGDTFKSEDFQGKILVVKCWFIHCQVCVKEFPELNELFDTYEGNENVEFLSVAFDKEDKLKDFLSKKEFRYPVVANQRNFIMNEVGAKQFPLHVLVNKEGKIVKMVNSAHTLIDYLAREVKK